MIVPQVLEEKWAEVLQELPVWQPPFRPVVVIAPHPDDETLGAGGLIASLRARGCPVTVVAVTDGERAYGPSEVLAQVRQKEQSAALRCLGVPSSSLVRLGLPDTSVTAHVAELGDLLLPLVSADTHLIAPWRGDFHPDHEACGEAAERVAEQTGALLTSYFFWTWHRGLPQTIQGLSLARFPLGREALQAKLKALACHVSQLEHSDGEPILPGYLLEPAHRQYETFLVA